MNKLSLLGTAIAMTFSMNANAIDLDLLTANDGITINGTSAVGTTTTSSVSDGSIAGGQRALQLSLTQSEFGNDVSLKVFNETLSLSAGSGSTATGIVQWNGLTGFQDLTDPSHFALDTNFSGDASGFLVEVKRVDLSFEFVVEAYTSLTQFTKVTIRSNSAQTEFFSFANLENPSLIGVNCGDDFSGDPTLYGVIGVECGAGSNTVDMANVQAIQLLLNTTGTVDVDFAFGPIRAVPEPATIALLGMGLLGLGASTTRRKKTS